MKKLLFIYFVIIAALFGSFAIASAKGMDDGLTEKVKETWIGVTGNIANPQATKFTLDYGKGKLTVEMNDWKWYTKNYDKMIGDKITVYGRLGETLFQGKFIDPTSIYDQKMGTYFFGKSRLSVLESRAMDDDPVIEFYGKGFPVEVGGVTIQGTVTSTNDKAFTIDTGKRKLTIDTSSLPNDPLDKNGYQAITKGDYLNVTGTISKAFMNKGELVADHIVVFQKG